MGFGSIVTSPRGTLSPQQALDLANVYLENASNTNDPDIALVLCNDTEVSLSHAKKAIKRIDEDQTVTEGIATAYVELGRLLEGRGYNAEAQASYKKAEKLGGNVHSPTRPPKSSQQGVVAQSIKGALLVSGGPQAFGAVGQLQQDRNIIIAPRHIFSQDVRPPTIDFKLPEPEERLNSTHQLACCLNIMRIGHSPDDILDPATQKWLRVIEKDTDEQERLHALVTDVIRAFKRDEFKDGKAVAEVVCLASVLVKEDYRYLLKELYSGIEKSDLLEYHQLHGLAQLIQDADPGHLDADDLVKTLQLLNMRLNNTHNQSSHHMYQLTIAVSRVLDAMADAKVTGLDRKSLHEPLSTFLGGLKKSSDPYLVYQAAYAHQALLCVPDNESAWQSAMRHSGKVFKGVSGIVSAVKGIDLAKFIDSLEDIQKGLSGASKAFDLVMDTYKDVKSLVNSGQTLRKSLEGGLSFQYKRDWYAALRGADVLIRDGELSKFKKLVCDAPCRLDPAFQWGVCQRLGEIAGSPMWDMTTRRGAIAFLGEMYQNDEVWGRQPNVKQWILNILMQLATSSGSTVQVHNTIADTLLQDLKASGDDKKQALYRECKEKGPNAYPLHTTVQEQVSTTLLDRVQNRPDVEANIRILRRQRTKEHTNAVYITPQAKASIHVPDETRFPLMEKVKGFLEGDQKVFLLMGDAGAGKSTFSRELELQLWHTYKTKTDRIPLYINLPTIDRPEQDMIAKQLRRAEFTEAQIREMKHYRKFILICDGYDESQQTHNLYMSNRLNQEGGWDAQMVVSCRSEYIGADYRDRFQPGDRNRPSKAGQLQEAVITPFSIDQIHGYIDQYVTVHQPLWQANEYKQALDLIPSLKELVKNPFLMVLSLEVLPRMMDPGQHLSSTRVTRVTLYDHFIEQWLERGKKRLSEKDMTPQARAMFEILSDEGFTMNGIDFLKKLAVAIYKEQDGHPIVEYSRYKDEGTWKAEFFNRKDRRILREACPLVRNGCQHRFIHRTLQEYGLARAIFDPQDWGDVSSYNDTTIVDERNPRSTLKHKTEKKPDPSSPLVWRTFVSDHSLLHFLEERVQQEPIFKEQLFGYIEYSKKDKKWSVAAANAITILVRAGVQFNDADLRGIQISGADLSYGMFDSAQLQGADLRDVNMRGIWLRNATFGRARMTGVKFGAFSHTQFEFPVHSFAYSVDEASYAVGLDQGTVFVYSSFTREWIHRLEGHSGRVLRVVYSPLGGQIASCGDDRILRLWSLKDGKCLHTLAGHSEKITCLAYSPQGDEVATASSDKTLRLWDTKTGACSRTFTGHEGEVTSVAYSSKGDEIISGSTDCTVRLWSIESGECSRTITGHQSKVQDVAYSPLDDQFASASEDKTVRLWDKKTGSCRHILEGHSGAVNCVTFSPKGDRIASGDQDGIVRLWDTDSGKCLDVLTGHPLAVLCLAYSPFSDQIGAGGKDNSLRSWNISAKPSRFHSSGHSRCAYSVQCSQNGRFITSGSMDRTIRLWDAESGTPLQVLRGHDNTVFSVANSPLDDMIVSGSADNTVRLWDVDTGSCRHSLRGHTGDVYCVAFSPQGHRIVSSSMDTTVRIWDVLTGDCVGTLTDHTDEVRSVTYSPDGRLIASSSKDGTIRIWNVELLTCLRILNNHGKSVLQVEFSPKQRQLASADEDGIVRLWDIDTGDCLLTLPGHQGRVNCIAFSPEGDVIASGGQDRAVQICDVASGRCLLKIRDFQDSVYGIHWRITSGAVSMATGSYDGSVVMWRITRERGPSFHVLLQWSARSGALVLAGASMQFVRGMSQKDQLLLTFLHGSNQSEFQFIVGFAVLYTCAIVTGLARHWRIGLHWKQPWVLIIEWLFWIKVPKMLLSKVPDLRRILSRYWISAEIFNGVVLCLLIIIPIVLLKIPDLFA